MPRVTVGNMMLGVAGLAVLLGAFRIHLSLGSLLFGLVSVGLVRVQRWHVAEQAAGRVATRRGLIRLFAASLGTTGLMIAIVAAPALVWPWYRPRHCHDFFTLEKAVSGSICCALVGWGGLRFIGRPRRD